MGHPLADVDDFALVRLELDQAGEAAGGRLELGRALHRGEVVSRFPLEVVEDTRAVGTAMDGRRDEPGKRRGDLVEDVDVDPHDLVLVRRFAGGRCW